MSQVVPFDRRRARADRRKLRTFLARDRRSGLADRRRRGQCRAIISGLISGSVYALLAIGFSLIFGVARIVNIAHTAFYMLAGYCIYNVTHKMGFHPLWGMVAAIALVTLLGLISYKIFINPIREHEGAVLIATIAMAMAFQEIMALIFTGTYLSVPSLIKGYLLILGVKVFYQQLLTFCVALIIMAVLWALLMRTKLGLAIRSTAQDREVANLMGINDARVAMMTMAVSVGLAAFTGAVVVPLTIVEPHMWMHPLFMMMASRHRAPSLPLAVNARFLRCASLRGRVVRANRAGGPGSLGAA